MSTWPSLQQLFSLLPKCHLPTDHTTMTAEQEERPISLQQYCVTGDPEISSQAKAVFLNYSGIPESEIVAHVRAVVSLPIASAAPPAR